MSKKLYKNKTELKRKCESAMKSLGKKYNGLVSPRLFRVELGVSKYVLSNWKKTQPEYYNLIKVYEDILLAGVEQVLLITSAQGKNTRGLHNILRAYDREKYIPEITMNQVAPDEVPQIVWDIPQIKKKGKQSVNKLKLITDK